MHLKYTLESIDTTHSDLYYYSMIRKWNQSRDDDDEVYKLMLAYDLSSIPPSKQDIFIAFARRRFVWGEHKKDISAIEAFYNGIYTDQDIVYDRISDE